MTDVATPVPITRSRRAWIAPVAVAGLGLLGAAYVAANNPSDRGAYLRCPFHAATGLWCPGCGLTRGLHRLLTGDVVGALGMNLFVPIVVGVLGYAWLTWFAGSVGRPLPSLGRVPSRAWAVLCVAAFVFAVLRNLPPFAVLAP